MATSIILCVIQCNPFSRSLLFSRISSLSIDLRAMYLLIPLNIVSPLSVWKYSEGNKTTMYIKVSKFFDAIVRE